LNIAILRNGNKKNESWLRLIQTLLATSISCLAAGRGTALAGSNSSDSTKTRIARPDSNKNQLE
jgi:hypothetical protein